MTTTNNPIVNSGLLYVNGLQIAPTSFATLATTLFLSPGSARDSTNINDIILSSQLMLNGKSVGPNGVDSAPFLPSKFYAVYVIGDSTDNKPTAGLFSLSPTFPSLPSGYDMFRRVGWILTAGNSNILSFAQLGVNEDRIYYYYDSFLVLSGGSSTSYVPVNLSAFVPPISIANPTAPINEVFLNLAYTPASASNRVEFNNFSFAFGLVQFGCGIAALQYGSVRVPVQNQQTFYRTGLGDTVNMNVSGYTDYLS